MKRTQFLSSLLLGGTITLLMLGGVGPEPVGANATAQPPQENRPCEDGEGRPMPPPPRRDISAATVPVPVLASFLNLTNVQQEKIKSINQTLRETMRAQMPPPPGGPENEGEGGGQMPPAPPSEEEQVQRDANRKERETEASKKVEAVLTTDQKKKLVVVLQAMTALQASRVSPPVMEQLKLTDAQLKQLAALGKNTTGQKVKAVLTDGQNALLRASRPARGGSRPGGPDIGPGGEPAPPPPAF